jgi:hypothetical protein
MQRDHEFGVTRIHLARTKYKRTLLKAHFAYLNKPSDRNAPLIDSVPRNFTRQVLAHGRLEFKEFINIVSESINLHQQRCAPLINSAILFTHITRLIILLYFIDK